MFKKYLIFLLIIFTSCNIKAKNDNVTILNDTPYNKNDFFIANNYDFSLFEIVEMIKYSKDGEKGYGVIFLQKNVDKIKTALDQTRNLPKDYVNLKLIDDSNNEILSTNIKFSDILDNSEFLGMTNFVFRIPYEKPFPKKAILYFKNINKLTQEININLEDVYFEHMNNLNGNSTSLDFIEAEISLIDSKIVKDMYIRGNDRNEVILNIRLKCAFKNNYNLEMLKNKNLSIFVQTQNGMVFGPNSKKYIDEEDIINLFFTINKDIDLENLVISIDEKTIKINLID